MYIQTNEALTSLSTRNPSEPDAATRKTELPMTREELKEIIRTALKIAQEKQRAPRSACIFSDDTDDTNPCDVTTFYGINEES